MLHSIYSLDELNRLIWMDNRRLHLKREHVMEKDMILMRTRRSRIRHEPSFTGVPLSKGTPDLKFRPL